MVDIQDSSDKKLDAATTRPNNNLRSIVLAVFIIAGALLLTHWSVFSQPEQTRWMGLGDAHLVRGPTSFLMDYALHELHEFPLWNPFIFCGTPYAAHPGRTAFYPFHLLRSLLTFDPTPLKTFFGIVIVAYLHYLLAGVGVFLLGRNQGLSFGGALTAAFIFIFGASFVYRSIGHRGFCIMIAWFPFVLLFLTKALSPANLKHKLYYAALAGAALGMMLLFGVPQIIVLTGFTMAAYYILHRVLHFATDLKAAQSLPRLLANDVSVVLMLSTIAIALSTVAWLPALESASYSARTKDAAENLFVRTPEVPEFTDVQLLVMYSGSRNLEGLRFAGTGALVLGVAALVHARRRRVYLYGILFCILVSCSLGPPSIFAKFLNAISPFQMSNPTRAVIFACLPLGLLAGFGVDAVTHAIRSRRRYTLQTIIVTAISLMLLSVLYPLLNQHPFLPVSPWLIAVPVAILIASIALPWFTGWPRRNLQQIGLALLVFAETFSWNFVMMPDYFRGMKEPHNLAKLSVQPEMWMDNRRGVSDPGRQNVFLNDLEPAMDGSDPLYISRVRQILCSPALEKIYRRHIDSYEIVHAQERGHLFLKRPFWLARRYVNGPLPGKFSKFPAATTVYLPQPQPALPVPQIQAQDVHPVGISFNREKKLIGPFTLQIDLNDPATFYFDTGPIELPPLHSSISLPYTSGNAHGRFDISLTDLDSGEQRRATYGYFRPTKGQLKTWEVVLPDFTRFRAIIKVKFDTPARDLEFDRPYTSSDLNDEDRLIRVANRTFNTVDIEISDLPDHRILLFTDAYYPGWRAYINGNRAPIIMANDGFKAVSVPPGSSSVRFEFRPWRVYVSATISVLVALTLFTTLILTRSAVKPAQTT